MCPLQVLRNKPCPFLANLPSDGVDFVMSPDAAAALAEAEADAERERLQAELLRHYLAQQHQQAAGTCSQLVLPVRRVGRVGLACGDYCKECVTCATRDSEGRAICSSRIL